jgi:ribonucleotide reductase alpha subunit
MVILNADHPDILEFIRCKAEEEKKAWALIDAGYDGSFTGEAYGSIFFQNSNNSVRVTDAFMKAVVEDQAWQTLAVRDGQPMETYRARDLFREISEAPGCAVTRAAVRHHRERVAHLPEHGAASTPATPAPSTCSSTTRPATWRR